MTNQEQTLIKHFQYVTLIETEKDAPRGRGSSLFTQNQSLVGLVFGKDVLH